MFHETAPFRGGCDSPVRHHRLCPARIVRQADPTRPGEVFQVELSTSEAAPYTLVYVKGLPAGHPRQGATARVGTETVPLVYDSASARFAFGVPGIPTGRTDVVFPVGSGSREVRAPLTVRAPEFLAGSAEATVDSLFRSLDAAAGAMTQLQLVVDAQRNPEAAERLRKLSRILRTTQERIEEMTEEERRVFASIYSANRAVFEPLLAMGPEIFNDLRTDVPGIDVSRAPAGSSAHGALFAAQSPEPVETAATMIRECGRGLSAIDQMKTALEVFDAISLVVATVVQLAPPPVQIAVAGLSVVITGFMDARMLRR